ncbi:hypothetical protein CDD82_6195 [Ophiocordyceps australis]|uniref:Uncharacterized protein n=1 Tax=Ophiocordyceps australis TaxID=1399860 RepID=A0A2C5YWZ0_9HYPO|nr:hypothetical protein CDD82_6195 [Ophiocordyceps australis]
MTWIEEHRAVLALWRLQLYYELRHAQLRNDLDWDERDLDSLETLPRDEIFLASTAKHQVSTVHDSISDLCSPDHQWRLPRPPHDQEFSQSCQPRPPPLFARFKIPQGAAPKRSLPSPEPGDGRFWRHRFGQGPTSAKWCNFQNSVLAELYFRHLQGDGRQVWLRELGFEPFCKFGLAFWEADRLVELGLVPAWETSSDSAYLNRWRALVADQVGE